jgi:hypothetical protein
MGTGRKRPQVGEEAGLKPSASTAQPTQAGARTGIKRSRRCRALGLLGFFPWRSTSSSRAIFSFSRWFGSRTTDRDLVLRIGTFERD